MQPIHERVLSVANRIAQKPEWTFQLADVVQALPDLNERSVRTHVGSRCCVDAPAHHAHRLPYFTKVDRGIYQVLPKYRQLPAAGRTQETSADGAARDVVHAVVSASDGAFTAECLEVAVVTEGKSLDAAVRNLKEALVLHLTGEELADFGLRSPLRLQISIDEPLGL